MGFYFSEDGRYHTSTFGFPPTTSLTSKGVVDTDAAITIQRWWRRILNMRLQEFATTSSKCSLEVPCECILCHQNFDPLLFPYYHSCIAKPNRNLVIIK